MLIEVKMRGIRAFLRRNCIRSIRDLRGRKAKEQVKDGAGVGLYLPESNWDGGRPVGPKRKATGKV